MTPEEKKEKARIYAREYYAKKREEAKKQKRRDYARAYYYKKRDITDQPVPLHMAISFSKIPKYALEEKIKKIAKILNEQ